MRNASRLQVATVATALFLGGSVAGGLALRSGDPASSSQATTAPEVIHKRKIKTVHVPSSPPAAGSSGTPIGVAVATPVSAPAPAPVSSRTSPGGGAGATGGGGEREYEGGESGGESD